MGIAVAQSDPRLYRLNLERLRHALGTLKFVAADVLLHEHVDSMASQRDDELADVVFVRSLRTIVIHYWCVTEVIGSPPRRVVSAASISGSMFSVMKCTLPSAIAK